MFDWQTNLFFLLLISFSGFDLILSDCGADVDRLHGGFCNNRQDLNRFEDFNYRKDSERSADVTRRDGLVIRERFDFSGRQRVDRFDRDEIRRNSNSNRQLAESTDARMIHREVTEARHRLNDERERRFEDLNIGKDLERSADFTRRDERVVQENEIRRDLNNNHRMNAVVVERMILSEMEEARSRLNDERRHSNAERLDNRMRIRIERADVRHVNSEMREAKTDRDNRMERAIERRVNSERREPNSIRSGNRMERADQRRMNSKRREPNANRFENRMDRADERRINSEISEAKTDRYKRMERANERRVNSEMREAKTDRDNRMERADQRRMNSEGGEPNANRLKNRMERADEYRMDHRDNRMQRADILSRKISIFPEAKWTWSIIQFALIALIVCKMLKNDKRLKPKSFVVYIRDFLNTPTAKTIKTL